VTVILDRGRALAAAAVVARHTIPAARDTRDPSELCCVAARLWLLEVYGSAVIDRAPLADWHLWDVRRPWSPVDAAHAVGVAEGPPRAYGSHPGLGVWYVQIWRGTPGAPGVTGHTLVWLTDGAGDGWQLDSVEGRAYDLRVRSWAELVAEARGGHQAVRLLAPSHATP
jgi:hypothetical protein